MRANNRYLLWLIAFCAVLIAGGASAGVAKSPSAEEKAMREKMEMMEKMEMLEKMEIADHLDDAHACAAAKNFNCAQDKLGKAKRLAADSADQGKIANAQSAIAEQKTRHEEEQRRIAAEQRRQQELAAAEQKRKQNLATYLAAANECLAAYNWVCVTDEFKKARPLAKTDAEKQAFEALRNKVIQVAEAVNAAKSTGGGSGGGSSYASNNSGGYKPSYSSSSSSSYSYDRAMTASTEQHIKAMNTITDRAIKNYQRQDDYNRSCCGRR